MPAWGDTRKAMDSAFTACPTSFPPRADGAGGDGEHGVGGGRKAEALARPSGWRHHQKVPDSKSGVP
jgi:hypothetical protein